MKRSRLIKGTDAVLDADASVLSLPRTPGCCSTSVWWEDPHFTATCPLRTAGRSTTLLSTGEGVERRLSYRTDADDAEQLDSRLSLCPVSAQTRRSRVDPLYGTKM